MKKGLQMKDGNSLVALLGKSEQDGQVKEVLANFGINTPLPRPKKGEIKIYVEPANKGIDFIFRYAEVLFPGSSDYAEGELIFDTIFFYPQAKGKKKEDQIALPFGLSVEFDRGHAYQKFGKPDWSSPRGNADKWLMKNISLHLEFDKDLKSIRLITISVHAG